MGETMKDRPTIFKKSHYWAVKIPMMPQMYFHQQQNALDEIEAYSKNSVVYYKANATKFGKAMQMLNALEKLEAERFNK